MFQAVHTQISSQSGDTLFHCSLCELEFMKNTEPSEKYKNKVKDFQKLKAALET